MIALFINEYFYNRRWNLSRRRSIELAWASVKFARHFQRRMK